MDHLGFVPADLNSLGKPLRLKSLNECLLAAMQATMSLAMPMALEDL